MTARLLEHRLQDPTSHEEHVRAHGHLPTMSGAPARAALLDVVDASGLVGRGGAGFPIARKLRAVASGSAGPPVVVANGCEGEPASRKDAWLLTRAPHLVLDGMQVAAVAVGATDAHLVVHRGSPAVAAVRRALAARAGVDAVRVSLHLLPRRYVSSEESAIVQFLNGRDARPAYTPPRPFERGVGGRPTLVNNVETLAHLALLSRHGSQWFRTAGDAVTPGTMLLTVSGPPDVTTVCEVETGTTIGAALDRCGVDRAAVSAVLVGGYFGTWLSTESAFAAPLTQQGMQDVGGALGAGVVLALPRMQCGVVETARVAGYLATQSAGQCGPCLNGLPAIADGLRRLARGPWDERFAPALNRWLAVVPGRGACRMPDGATRFVVSGLRTFAADVAAHRAGRPCPASGSPGWLPLPHAADIDSEWR